MRKDDSSASLLVLVASDRLPPSELSALREWAAAGARIVAWQHPAIVQERFPGPDVASYLERNGIPAIPLVKALPEGGDEEIDEAVIAWMKSFGRTELEGGKSFRALFRYRRLSLWWWAELFLYHDTPLRLLVRDVEALARLLERQRPEKLVVVGPVRNLDRAASALAGGRVEVRGPRAPTAAPRSQAGPIFLGTMIKMMGTGLKSLFRRPPPPIEGRRKALFLTHASMWKGGVEMYFDRVPADLEDRGFAVRMVAFGPPVPFRKRTLSALLADVLELGESRFPYVPVRRYFGPRLTARVTAASFSCWRMCRRFRRLPGLEERLAHRGVPLGNEALASFRDTFLLQLPWAIRSYHEMETVLRRERPDVLVLYAESSGLGRAAIAAARSLGVPSFALQHGIMYPRYYSHEHADHEVAPDADGGEAVPLPDRTAVFGELARDLLVRRGHYPPESIVITGSPKFDALVATARGYDREKLRRRWLGEGGGSLLVVASRFSALGPVFCELVEAAERLPGLTLLVKPHPAESTGPYEKVLAETRASRVAIVSPGESLIELLFASDGLITVDSLASSEALVLGRPVLVVSLPSNLGPLVARGAALGVRRGEPIEPALRRLLSDEEAGRELERRRREYIVEFAFGADGRSTERIVRALEEIAGSARPEPVPAP